MLRRSTFILAFAVAAIVALSARVARAQATTTTTTPTTTTTSGPSLIFSQQIYPDRIQNGVDIGTGPRPENLNPLGISYADCINDQILEFYVVANGFDGQNVGIWATQVGTCSNYADIGDPGSIDCWYLATGSTSLVSNGMVQDYKIRVQDLVGFMNGAPQTFGYQPQGKDACNAQTTSSGVGLTIYFVPLDGDYPTGTALTYQINVDMVGPAPPANVSIADGDTLFVVNWTQNSDADTQGYNIYLDSLGSAASTGDRDAASTIDATLVCPGADAAIASSDAASTVAAASVDLDAAGADPDASEDASDDSPSDASSTADATLSDASATGGNACYLVYPSNNSTNAGAGGSCGGGDPNLEGSTVVDASALVIPVYNEAGELEEAGSSVGAGISQVSSKYLVGGAAGETVSGESAGSYTITGLTNGTTYAVVVSAVDAFGNVGPPSPEVCDYPAPVNDFWKVYRTDGGGAGGFCALEAVGAPVGSTMGLGVAGVFFVGLVRRRRRRRR